MEKSDFKKSQTPRTARGGVASASERKDSWRTDSSPRRAWVLGCAQGFFSRMGARVLGCAGVCAARVFLGAWIGPARIFRCAGVSPARVLGGLRARVAGAGIFGAGVTATGVGSAGITSAACEGVDEVRLVVAAPGLGGDVHPGSGLDGGWANRFRPPVRQRGFHHVDAHVLAGGGAHAQIALAVAGDLADEHDGLAPRPGRAARTRVARIPATRVFRRLGAWVRATGVLRRLRARVGPAGIFRRTRVFGRTRILGARIFCRARIFCARVGPAGIFRRARVLGAWVRRLGRKGGPNRGDQKRGEQDKPRFSQHGSSSLGG